MASLRLPSLLSNLSPSTRRLVIFVPPLIFGGYYLYRRLLAAESKQRKSRDKFPVSDSIDSLTTQSQSRLDTPDGNSCSSFMNGPLGGKSKCSSCKNMQKLTFKEVDVSQTSIKNLSSGQLVKYTHEQLNNVIKALEELRLKTNNFVKDDTSGFDSEEKLNELYDKLNEIQIDFELFRENAMPANYGRQMVTYDADLNAEDNFDDTASFMSSASMGYWDPEPNLHFFEIYQDALRNLDSIIVPRTDRTIHTSCESREDWLAKVHCLRIAFAKLLSDRSIRERFTKIGESFLRVVLNHNLRDSYEAIAAYYAFIRFIENPENLETITKELAHRNINVVSFYDIVLDYMILESFDDLENPPGAVKSVMSNRWLSASFRELSLQTAVSAVLRRKRSKLIVSDGFFAHFYNILDHISPLIAWGFLGTDEDLKFKCQCMKDSATELIRDFFSFDRCRYTSYEDLCEDILRVVQERNFELNSKLEVLYE